MGCYGQANGMKRNSQSMKIRRLLRVPKWSKTHVYVEENLFNDETAD